MTIGERIRERRKALGYTQKQLGKLCGGMADSAIRKYESGKITPKRSTLVKIAHALQVPLWALSDDDLEIDTDGSGGGNMKKVFRMAYKMVWHSCEEEVPPITVGSDFKLYLVTHGEILFTWNEIQYGAFRDNDENTGPYRYFFFEVPHDEAGIYFDTPDDLFNHLVQGHRLKDIITHVKVDFR